MSSWAANQTKVPMGLPAFAKELGLPLQLYAPYFCNDTVYDQANGHAEGTETHINPPARSAWNFKSFPISFLTGRWPFTAANEALPGCDGYAFKNVAPDAARDFYTYAATCVNHPTIS
eukprot:COSAG05_NODE_1534_length_4616_cov_6.656409_6_plen_118_part_00